MLQERRSKLVGSEAMMTMAEPLRDNPPAAPRAGADLYAARERLGWTLQAMADHLRIKAAHLEALEAGDLARLPGNAYALAFVRTYASALGLDAEEMLRRFRTEAAHVNQRIRLDFPAPVPERGLPAGAMVLLGLVLSIAAYAGWYRLSGEGKLPAETVSAVPARLAPLAEQALPPPPARHVEVVSEPAAPAISIAPVVESIPAPVISPSSAAAAPVMMPMTLPTAAPAPAEEASRLVIRANADAWISVRDKAGQQILNRVLKAGETWAVPARGGLVMTTGNAGGTELLLDGAPTASLGTSGSVRRDLPLEPDLVKDGKLAPTPAAVVPSALPVAVRRQN